MSRYFPTLRGWIAFVLPAFAILYFPLLRPALIVESGRGTFVAEPVTPKVWIIGAFLIGRPTFPPPLRGQISVIEDRKPAWCLRPGELAKSLLLVA